MVTWLVPITARWPLSCLCWAYVCSGRSYAPRKVTAACWGGHSVFGFSWHCQTVPQSACASLRCHQPCVCFPSLHSRVDTWNAQFSCCSVIHSSRLGSGMHSGFHWHFPAESWCCVTVHELIGHSEILMWKVSVHVFGKCLIQLSFFVVCGNSTLCTVDTRF